MKCVEHALSQIIPRLFSNGKIDVERQRSGSGKIQNTIQSSCFFDGIFQKRQMERETFIIIKERTHPRFDLTVIGGFAEHHEPVA
jgi:hypothetical protein